jgi:hypothetical protein
MSGFVKNTHGGPGRGQGRKPLYEGENMVITSIRLPLSLSKKVELLGGADWIRAALDAEPDAVVPVIHKRKFRGL